MGVAEDDEDSVLMLAFQQGDCGAFDTLFARYTPRLLAFLGRMLPDRARAEELAQDAFVRIYQARERYAPTARFSTYLFGIAQRLAWNELARARHRRERSATSHADEVGSAVAVQAASDEVLESARVQSAVECALRELPDRQRAALVLRIEQGLSYDEIAQALDVSTASVKALIHRGRSALAKRLEGIVRE